MQNEFTFSRKKQKLNACGQHGRGIEPSAQLSSFHCSPAQPSPVQPRPEKKGRVSVLFPFLSFCEKRKEGDSRKIYRKLHAGEYVVSVFFFALRFADNHRGDTLSRLRCLIKSNKTDRDVADLRCDVNPHLFFQKYQSWTKTTTNKR